MKKIKLLKQLQKKKIVKRLMCVGIGLMVAVSFCPLDLYALSNGKELRSGLGAIPVRKITPGETFITGDYLFDKNIEVVDDEPGENAINISGRVRFIFKNDCSLKFEAGPGEGTKLGGGAGIYLPEGSTLILEGKGHLTSRGGKGVKGQAGGDGAAPEQSSGGLKGRAGMCGSGGAGGAGGGAGGTGHLWLNDSRPLGFGGGGGAGYGNNLVTCGGLTLGIKYNDISIAAQNGGDGSSLRSGKGGSGCGYRAFWSGKGGDGGQAGENSFSADGGQLYSVRTINTEARGIKGSDANKFVGKGAKNIKIAQSQISCINF